MTRLREVNDGTALLAIQAATLFELSESGRLLRQNSRERSPAPRVWIAASASGRVVRVRADVGPETARAIEALAASEPPTHPVCVREYERLLAAEAPVEEVLRGLTYAVPSSLRYEHSIAIVGSGTPAGDALVARVQTSGMPSDLARMGFVDATHLWPPWCAALNEGRIVAVALTARLSAVGAEVGVATVPAARGRGFASAATAAWASLEPLGRRARFYSTELENVSSQRVAARLGLPFVGATVAFR